MVLPKTGTLVAEGAFIDKQALTIELDGDGATSPFFAGDAIQGKIVAPGAVTAASRVAVALSCTYRDSESKTTLFKLLVSPSPVIQANETSVGFCLPLPSNLPCTMNDSSLPGAVTYKIKAMQEVPSLPLCLQPKASVPLTILDHISSTSNAYQSPISNEKEIKFTTDKDLTTKEKKWTKGAALPVSAKLSLPHSCFLPGHSIPISLVVQHVVPVKHMQGVQLHLERLVVVLRPGGERSMDSQLVSHATLPLICDVDASRASIHTRLAVPEATIASTLHASAPMQVSYRVRVAISVDPSQLVEDGCSPVRKRDQVKSWGKRLVVLANDDGDDGAVPANALFGNVIDLELPIVIGTTENAALQPNDDNDDENDNEKHQPYRVHSVVTPSTHFLTENWDKKDKKQLFFLEDRSSAHSPPQLPARPRSTLGLSHQASSPALFAVEKHYKPPLPPRSVTDPFALANLQAWTLVEPSAPDIHDFDTKS
ncbi:hypothetical protein BC940DRAFT_71525 [Gongronella butleri]|nr:hypothetical protein BC940DRAFT_71525 [Gongronella butleri]